MTVWDDLRPKIIPWEAFLYVNQCNKVDSQG